MRVRFMLSPMIAGRKQSGQSTRFKKNPFFPVSFLFRAQKTESESIFPWLRTSSQEFFSSVGVGAGGEFVQNSEKRNQNTECNCVVGESGELESICFKFVQTLNEIEV